MVLFTGQCAVHRGQIMRVHGAFAEALDEFERAVERYVLEDTTPAAGLAMSERGDVLRIRGDLQAAEEAFDAAIRFGHEAQPGLALLWLARGRQSAALGAIRRLLAEPRNPVHRSQLLPAGVQILLAAGETDQASALADELANLAESFECAAQRATAGHAVASVALARDDAAGAVAQLRVASRLWTELGATYEIARCRTLLGRAYQLLGDLDSAQTELTAARRTFAELGAVPAEREVSQLLQPAAPGGLTAREVEVLRLVATGRSNSEIATELVVSEKTVARHLSNIFGKLDVSSRTAAAAFAFEQNLL